MKTSNLHPVTLLFFAVSAWAAWEHVALFVILAFALGILYQRLCNESIAAGNAALQRESIGRTAAALSAEAEGKSNVA